jgi:hypothetical protein
MLRRLLALAIIAAALVAMPGCAKKAPTAKDGVGPQTADEQKALMQQKGGPTSGPMKMGGAKQSK